MHGVGTHACNAWESECQTTHTHLQIDSMLILTCTKECMKDYIHTCTTCRSIYSRPEVLCHVLFE